MLSIPRIALLRWRSARPSAAFLFGVIAASCGPGEPPSGTGGTGGAAGSSGGAAGQAGAGGAAGADGGGAGGAAGAVGGSAGASGGAGGVGASGGAAGQASGGAAGAVDGGGDGGPVSQFCGDAIRDTVIEECDDGAGTGEDACTNQCRAHNYFVVPPVVADSGPKLGSRTLGFGRHPAAAGAAASALAFVEKSGSTHALKAAFFDLQGHRQGAPVSVGSGASPTEQADPVVAALPGGKFALAWNDLAGGSLDVALRIIEPSGVLGAMVVANQTLPGAQQDPDVLWTGSELVVGWTDALQTKARRFDATLAALDSETAVSASSEVARSASLAQFGATWAVAWRSINSSGLELIRVKSGSTAWSVGPFVPGAPKERLAVIALDSTRLLVVFTEGTDPLATGTAGVTRLRMAVLDSATPGSAPSIQLLSTAEPWASDNTLAQSRPALARSGSRIYLAWQSESPVGDARSDELFVRELTWNGASVTLLAEIPIQTDAPRSAAQRAPVLAGSPLGPAGALVTVWEDSNIEPMHTMAPDLVFGLRPTPIVVLPNLALDGGA